MDLHPCNNKEDDEADEGNKENEEKNGKCDGCIPSAIVCWYS